MPIVKHNKLIETSYKLNSREQFFVLHLIAQISQGDNNFDEYEMHYSEIEKIINFDGKRRIANKSEVFTLMDKLNSEPIIYERGSVIGKSVWLQHMEHDTETDIFTFRLSEKLREYLLQLKEHFTRYNISNIVYLNGNAIRLYEVLKRYQYMGTCDLTIEKLKFYLGLEDRYPKFYEFKRWVLLPAQREIEKYTDIRFEFAPSKKIKKRILSLKFTIYENEPKYQSNTLTLLNKAAKEEHTPIKILSGGQSLSPSQMEAYRFLLDKGVNKAFITNQILEHQKVRYLPLQGFEDIYVRAVWKFFADKTTVQNDKMAGAFVSWWKNGRLTEDGLHARMVELVLLKRKAMSAEEIARRAPLHPPTDAQSSLANRVPELKGILFSPDTFDLEQFKGRHPNQYQLILKRIKSEYEAAFKDADKHFDPSKYRKAIESKVYQECKDWFFRAIKQS